MSKIEDALKKATALRDAVPGKDTGHTDTEGEPSGGSGWITVDSKGARPYTPGDVKGETAGKCRTASPSSSRWVRKKNIRSCSLSETDGNKRGDINS